MSLINKTSIGDEMKLASAKIRKRLNTGSDTSSNLAAQAIISEIEVVDTGT